MGYTLCSQRLAALAPNECLAAEKQTLRKSEALRRKRFYLFIYLFTFNGFLIAVTEKFSTCRVSLAVFLLPKNLVFLKLKICREISENYHLTQKCSSICSRI